MSDQNLKLKVAAFLRTIQRTLTNAQTAYLFMVQIVVLFLQLNASIKVAFFSVS